MAAKENYVDGFVLVVPKDKVTAYKKMAKEGADIWMKYGALDYKECIADDMKADWALPFPQLTNAKKNEVVFFSFITYKSRAHRDQVNAKVMKNMKEYDKDGKKMEMPFDVKRMAYGGFKVFVQG